VHDNFQLVSYGTSVLVICIMESSSNKAKGLSEFMVVQVVVCKGCTLALQDYPRKHSNKNFPSSKQRWRETVLSRYNLMFVGLCHLLH
jgi:hypothetical protein